MHFLRRLALAPRALLDAFNALLTDAEQRRRLPGVRFGNGVLIRGADRIRCADGVFIDHRAYLNASLVNDRRGFIQVGENVEIGPFSAIWGGGGVTIGNDVHIGAHVHITSMEGRQIAPETTDPYAPLHIDCSPVVIEDHVLVYSGAVLVPGVRIGHHACVGAGAVVIEDVPPYALVAGVPARVIRYSRDERAPAPADHVVV